MPDWTSDGSTGTRCDAVRRSPQRSAHISGSPTGSAAGHSGVKNRLGSLIQVNDSTPHPGSSGRDSWVLPRFMKAPSPWRQARSSRHDRA